MHVRAWAFPYRASLTGRGDWFGSAMRQAAAPSSRGGLIPLNKAGRGSGRGRSDRSRSPCHRSWTGPSHPALRRRGLHAGNGLPARYRSPALPRSTAAPRAPPVSAGSGEPNGEPNAGRRQATSGDNQPWFVQLDRSSGHTQQRPATLRMRLKAEGRRFDRSLTTRRSMISLKSWSGRAMPRRPALDLTSTSTMPPSWRLGHQRAWLVHFGGHGGGHARWCRLQFFGHGFVLW